MQQDSKLKDWEVVSPCKNRKKKSFIPYFWSILQSSESLLNEAVQLICPQLLSSALFTKEIQPDIFKSNYFFMKRK